MAYLARKSGCFRPRRLHRLRNLRQLGASRAQTKACAHLSQCNRRQAGRPRRRPFFHGRRLRRRPARTPTANAAGYAQSPGKGATALAGVPPIRASRGPAQGDAAPELGRQREAFALETPMRRQGRANFACEVCTHCAISRPTTAAPGGRSASTSCAILRIDPAPRALAALRGLRAYTAR